MKISENHYRMFMNVIAKLPQELGVLGQEFQRVFRGELSMQFPKRESAALFGVVGEPMRMQLGRYSVCGAATTPPHHFAIAEPVLELKLTRITGPDSHFAGVWLSMFPSGRLIFEGFGIAVDSEGVLSSISEDYFDQQTSEERPSALFYQFMWAMLLSIEVPDSKTRYIVERGKELIEAQMRHVLHLRHS